MKSVTFLSKLLRDNAGASLVEFSVAFPILALVALGTVDVTFLLWDWNSAAKATQVGVRLAVVSDPAAQYTAGTGPDALQYITKLEKRWDPTHSGDSCLAAEGEEAAYCPKINTVCTSTGCISRCTTTGCITGYTLNANAFNAIVSRMQEVFPRVQPQNVQIAYKTTGLGFVGRPGGLPMTVTVSLRCMTHDFFFLDGLMAWLTPPAAPDGCTGTPAGWPVLPSPATLISEDLQTIPTPI